MATGLFRTGLSFRAIVVMAIVLVVGCDKAKPTIDLSTPKAAAITFTRALEAGDSKTALAAANAGGIEKDLVESMAQSSSGLKRLEASANAKFGDDAKKLAVLHGPGDIVKTLLDADVEENAERATVISKDKRDSLQLQRVDGQWKVDIGALIRGQDVSRAVPMFQAAGKATRKVADDIDSGKCKTVNDALVQIATEINASMRASMGLPPLPANAAVPTTAAIANPLTAGPGAAVPGSATSKP